MAQAFDLLRQHNAEFGDEAAQVVVERGAFFHKPLAGAVQAKGGLPVFVLDEYEAHVRPGDGFDDAAASVASFLPHLLDMR